MEGMEDTDFLQWLRGPPDASRDPVGFQRWLEYPQRKEQVQRDHDLEATCMRMQQALICCAVTELLPAREERTDYHKLPRNYKWFYSCVCSVEGDVMFLIFFRITRSTFYCLLDLIQDHPLISRTTSKRHDYLTPEEQLAIALRYCASGDSFEGVGGLCGASRSSVHNAVVCVSIALFEHAPAWIRFPSCIDAAKCMAAEFESAGSWRNRQRGGMCTPGIPQVVGAMDGTQVLLAKRPENSGDAYINRKNWPALNVHAVVDSRMRFMDVNVGCAGRCHDAKVLEQSPLGAQLSDPASPLVQLFEAASVTINGVEVPLQLLGDSAYPSRRYVLPAYRDSQAIGSGRRTCFNSKHSTTRNVVERAFGVLKQRWRCLMRGSEASVITTTWVVVMCFMLHNVCMEMNEPQPYADEEFEELKSWYDERIEHREATMGEVRRVPRKKQVILATRRACARFW